MRVMQFWHLPGMFPQGTLIGQGLDSNYFIRGKMTAQKTFSRFNTAIKIDLNNGDGLFAVKSLEGNPNPLAAEGMLYAESLMELTCAPRFSFLGDSLVFDGSKAVLKTCVLWKVRTSL